MRRGQTGAASTHRGTKRLFALGLRELVFSFCEAAQGYRDEAESPR